MDPADRVDPELDRLLASARPLPDDSAVDRIERSVFGASRRLRGARLRPFGAALAAAGGLAVAFAAVSLAGLAPWSGAARDEARARDDCSLIVVKRVERRPQIVLSPEGEPHVRYRSQPVTRTERRCR